MWLGGVSRLAQMPQSGDRHHHRHHQVVLGFEGAADFELDGTGGEQLRIGGGCLVPTECGHAFQGLGDNRMLVLDFDLDSAIDSRIDREMLDRLFDRPHYFQLDDHFSTLLKAMAHELDLHGQDPQMQQHISALLLHSLYQRLTGQTLRAQESPGRLDMERIDQLIKQRLQDKVSVAELAQTCHLSLSQFHLRFRQTTGMTPYQYVMKHRLDQAVWLLRCSSHPIADIAVETGFSSQSALTHAIKNELGLSPGQVRRQQSS
ncbi:AraC family transcriptional regulator [Saccharospirillum sp. HFRX-1]|uniref:AraC family transcriptional regulator n=1 Tax=unclassified Saccharospirillum TaxID=2633430 RepID=UPI003721E4AB